MGNSLLGPNAITMGGSTDSIGFFGATPITQPDVIDENVAGVLQVLRDYGLISAGDGGGGGGGDGGIEVGTKAELLAKTGMSIGTMFYQNETNESHKNKLWTYSGRCWGVVGETVELQATDGLTAVVGNTVEISGSASTADFQFKLTNDSEDVHVVGVVGSLGTDGWCAIATRGAWEVASHTGTYDRANYLTCDSTDGLAHETTSVSAQPFAKILENKTVNIDGELVYAVLHTAEIY